MAFIHTVDLITILQTRLQSLKLDEQSESPEPLLQRVGVYGATQLAQAMKSVFASEQRVAFIVPGGDQHANQVSSTLLFSARTTRLALLIADRDMRGGALTGSASAFGILPMKDRIVDNLTTVPFTEADIAFAPAEGEPLIIADGDKPSGNLGRECWLQWLSCYAGTARQSVPY